MTEIIGHKDGMFSYADLQTIDLEAARTFYTDLFGWKVNEQPLGEGEVYLMFEKNGHTACAASRQSPEQTSQGMAPMWNTYFTVSEVDTRSKEAEAAGGSIYMHPFDVFDAGRMAVIADPAGAVFCLWEPKENIGAQVMGEPNTLSWAECASTDATKVRDFYTEVMGWTYDEMDMGDAGKYTLFKAEGESASGLMQNPMPGVPSYWMVYFEVADCRQMTERVKSMGGKTFMDSDVVPGVGVISVLADPQGAMFGMIEPEETD